MLSCINLVLLANINWEAELSLPKQYVAKEGDFSLCIQAGQFEPRSHDPYLRQFWAEHSWPRPIFNIPVSLGSYYQEYIPCTEGTNYPDPEILHPPEGLTKWTGHGSCQERIFH